MENRLPITPFKFKGRVKPSVNCRELHAALEIKEPFMHWYREAIALMAPFMERVDFDSFAEPMPMPLNFRILYKASVLCAHLVAVQTPSDAGEAVQDYLAKFL
jgi:hypothetical protein